VIVIRGEDRVGMEINEGGEDRTAVTLRLVPSAFDFGRRCGAVRSVRFGASERDPVHARVNLGAT
jgi:hypothetical protein